MRNDFDLTSDNNPTRRSVLVIAGCFGVFSCLAILAVAAWLFLFDDGGDEEQVSFQDEIASLIEDAVTEEAVEVVVNGAKTEITSTAVPLPAATETPKSKEPIVIVPTETAVPKPSLTPLPDFALDVPVEVDQSPLPARAYADLDAYFATNYPARDYYEVRQRVGNIDMGPRTLSFAGEYGVGDMIDFYADGVLLRATLAAVTEHAYFWVENGIELNKTAVSEAAIRFEREYYPHLNNLFGQVWTPGIDNDPRFSVMHVIGSEDAFELGYFTDVNQYPVSLYSDSNQQEMIYLNMTLLDLEDDIYFGTLVHEVQHLIQWNMDSNEMTWLNEGLAQLAELYVGLETSSTDEYVYQTDIQLNRWSYDDDKVDAQYAGAYLYSAYLWEQLGDAAIQELSRHPANGMTAVRSILDGYDGRGRSLTEFSTDFAVAVYLDDLDAGSEYYFAELNPDRPASEIYLDDIPLDTIGQLNQFGTHYVVLDFEGLATLSFAGNTVINMVDSPPRRGEEMWFAPPHNDSDVTLTAVVDLTNLSEATLRFNSWYDLEVDWDFAYFAVSADGGGTWEVVSPQHAHGHEFGPAFNGRSDEFGDAVDGWLKESISLDDYAGQTIQIRFEVVTDSAVTGKGFAISDVVITEMADVPLQWDAQGFVETGWQLPQIWGLQLIQYGDGTLAPQVMDIPLDGRNQAQQQIKLGENGGVLVLTPLTPFTDQPATYWLNIDE